MPYRVVPEVVGLAEIDECERFASKISRRALNLKCLPVILKRFFVLSLRGIDGAHLVECFAFLSAISGCLLDRLRLVKIVECLLILAEPVVDATDIEERVSFRILVSGVRSKGSDC